MTTTRKTQKQNKSLFNSELLVPAFKDSLRKFSPKDQIKNPVMFVVLVGAVVVSCVSLRKIFASESFGFEIQVAIWLWFTVLFANFSEALAEGRGKAQAASLRKTLSLTECRKLVQGKELRVNSAEIRKDDLVVCENGDIVPRDGEVVEGIASVDESAITGESAPVIREAGGDRSAVTGGTMVISDRIVVRITVAEGDSFLDKMIALVEGAERKKTPNEVALSLLLIILTILFLVVIFCLRYFGFYAGTELSWTSLIALLVCLIPTTIGGLLSAIGISGMDRLLRRNILAMSGRAVEAAGDVDVLLLDKTGTITLGNRMASEFIAVSGVSEKDLSHIAYLSSLADQTAEGKSILKLASEKFGFKDEGLEGELIEFSARTRLSGIDLAGGSRLRKGASDSVKKHIEALGGKWPSDIDTKIHSIAMKGGTPLVVSEDNRTLGVIYLKDIIKPGIRSRFQQLRQMGIRTIMITGDNPVTAAAIAAEAGVDDFLAEATPEAKLEKIKLEKQNGHMVAMVGDGTNDAPALAQADVGLAMNSGTPAAKEAANMVDLDSDPTKLIETVEIGKQLLMTRGALTTFSLANDVAKYFAIIPAMFVTLYAQTGVLEPLNVMGLHSPESAILSSVIFNAIIILLLLPLALKGVKYEPRPAHEVFLKNFCIYGMGGLIAPFVGIKILDVALVALKLV
ncbi:MAG: potassium-transporting ATPase subunit KdpB [Bdellovibrionota bacterium]